MASQAPTRLLSEATPIIGVVEELFCPASGAG